MVVGMLVVLLFPLVLAVIAGLATHLRRNESDRGGASWSLPQAE